MADPCDPATVLAQAKCLKCLDDEQAEAVAVAVLCEWAEEEEEE